MRTFHDSSEAESELSQDVSNFLARQDITQLIPPDIMQYIKQREANARITAFKELFIVLNTHQSADGLRKLIVDYFNGTTYLRGHLS